MRKNSWTLSVVVLVAIAGIMIFYPAGQVEAPFIQQNETKKRIIPNQMETKQSQQLVVMDSIQYGENLVRKLDTSKSIGVIKHKTKVSSHYRNHEVTVKFKTKPTQRELTLWANEISAKVIKQLDSTYIIKSEMFTTPKLINYFSEKSNVIYAEPNYIYLQNETDDELYKRYQWNLPAIRTEEGWEITRGKEDVTIAIIDTGIDLEHPDLSKRIVKGYNVLNDSPLPNDENGHGTHVAGIIASETNNGLGVAGITWYNQIMPIKAMNAEGYGTSFDVAKGVRWAVENGADVINMSLGNYKSSKALKEAIDYAFEKDVILVAASGNENTNQISYPAAFDKVIGVAAVNTELTRADFSNFGEYIDVAAPGVDIASTYLKGQYASLSGTSMATPHVAALAGLIRSSQPQLTNKEIIEIIKDTTDDVGNPGKDQYTGHGIINVSAALKYANEKDRPFAKVKEWIKNIK
ncbi:S8 family peptidase [Pseudalkalibacillus berkeleyi]|uniref:S8 family peptidase n=1 Tax=Pseudalkalibacillus berkeleyi TaxID=1069813 RepID=A0ABS9H0S9_9BACL|nr:S8 family peptidase [Pseudalkalibacillus berkeleyi]MCF6137378.1 S8 family peptidase [Pseudalkalibacillus berkeleyi]